MSITFACSRCGQQYSVDPSLAGKKVRCKGCGEVVRIPAPRPSGPKAAEKPDRPSAKPKGPSPTPRAAAEMFPSWLDEADEEASDAPALPRPSGPRAKARGGDFASERSSGLDPATVKYLVIGGAAAIVLIATVVAAALFLSRSSAPGTNAAAAHEQVVAEGLSALEKLSGHLAGIEDQDSARSRVPQVKAAVGALAAVAGRAATLPRLPPGEEQQLDAKYRTQTGAALRKWKQELERIKALPGVPEELQDAIAEAP